MFSVIGPAEIESLKNAAQEFYHCGTEKLKEWRDKNEYVFLCVCLFLFCCCCYCVCVWTKMSMTLCFWVCVCVCGWGGDKNECVCVFSGEQMSKMDFARAGMLLSTDSSNNIFGGQ